MVSDTVLVDRLWEVLRVCDLEITTAATVRRQLEEEFGVDLLERKAFIRDQIDHFMRTHVTETPNDDVQAEEEDDEQGASENVKEEENGDSCSLEEEEVEDEGDTGTKKKPRLNKMNGEAKKKGGFNKPCALSPQLQKLVGESELGRSEVVKKIWAYIREKNLQNPGNKRKILCDEILTGIFRVKTIDMFKMNKVLSKHIWPIEENNASQVKSSKKRQLKRGRIDDDEPKQIEKKQKGGGSGFLAPVRLSDALVKFFRIDENALSRADVIKRIWQYIKENELQDPSDKKTIICDERLKELFQVDSFHGFTVAKLLTAHFIKKED